MSINSFLNQKSNELIIRDSEKDSIKKSVDTLKSRLVYHFGNNIEDKRVFGSYPRGTILPRCYDEGSDVDLMVVFDDKSYQPQTYLNWLRTFVNKYYSSSQIRQSHPTIVLELNHIKFELVPALNQQWYGYQIPNKGSDYQSWMYSEPFSFNNEFTQKNIDNYNLIKPLARLVKFWNVKNGRPYYSFKIEEMIKAHYFYGANNNLKGYFYSFMMSLSEWEFAFNSNQYNKIVKTKKVISEAYQDDVDGYPNLAEPNIKKLFD